MLSDPIITARFQTLSPDFNPSVDYVVESLDIDRKTGEPRFCPMLEKAFGPRFGKGVVFVYNCKK